LNARRTSRATTPSEFVIYPKTHDLILWLTQHAMNFPKSQRFVMAKRVQDTALEFYELLIEARKVDVQPRKAVLLAADVKLETLRLHLRLCHELHLLSSSQYQHVSQMVTEIGKLLGSWRHGKRKNSQSQR